jgi:hypothetical protein
LPRKIDTSPATPVININTSAPASSPENEKPETPREEKPPNWFFTELADKPAHEWGRVWSLELHRLKPDVPGVPGTKGYLRLFSEPVTLETIRSNFGGGRFRLNLCKNGRWHTSHEFEIEGQPVYDPNRERPATNGNGNGNVGIGDLVTMLREELQRSRDGQAPGGEEVIKMLTSASEKAMEIVTKQTTPATDPASQLNALLTAAKSLADLRAPQSNGLGELGQYLGPLLKAVMEKLISPPDPLAELQKMAGLIDVLEKIRGGAGDAPPKDWRAAAVQAVTNHLPEILDTFKTTSANTVAANQARARAAEVIRGAAPAAVPAAAPTNPAPASAAAPAPPVHSNGGLRLVPRDSVDETPVQQGAPAETATASPLSVEEHRHALKINVVNLFMHGASGSSIASYVEDVDPEFAADFGKYTTDQIISFFATDEILKVMVDSTLPPSDPTFPTRLHEVLADAREFVTEGAALPVN